MQQASKGLQVGVLVSPAGKVTNMACTADFCGPDLRRLHHCLIKPDRKDHQLLLSPFLLKSRFDFRLHPLASNRVLRENKQEFVTSPNRLVNAGPNLVTDFHVMWSKPAMHTLVP